MVQTLIFKDGKFKRSVPKIPNASNKLLKGELSWTHILKSEISELDDILDDIYHENSKEHFRENLLEKQRPGLLNFSNFTFVSISVPNKDMLDFDSKGTGLLQISFIITRNRIYSIGGAGSEAMTDVTKELKEVYLDENSVDDLFSHIIEDFIEYSIDIIESMKQKIDLLQKQIIVKSHLKDMYSIYERLENRKEALFFSSKAIRADIELIKDIDSDMGKHLGRSKFLSHVEDRFLYCFDLVETQKESLDSTYDIYLGAQQNQMNRQIYKLSWLGAFLLVPTIVTSFFGMNVPLPVHSFWAVVVITIVASGAFALWLKMN